MPPTTPSKKHQYRVTVTGYGPFNGYAENPSWNAVKDLNGTVLTAKRPPNASDQFTPDIHITTFEIPVAYSDVLDVVPNLHLRPPVLPSFSTYPGLAPPTDGYDFILHVGVGWPGGFALEKRGRKVGYNIPDVNHKLAPVIVPTAPRQSVATTRILESSAQKYERQRVADAGLYAGDQNDVNRGFGEGYEDFPEELWNEMDVEEIVKHLRYNGFLNTISSTDAGLYLCEFINYCALAEARRCASKHFKPSKVLFLHVPPVSETVPLKEMTQVITSIVQYVCWGMSDPRA